MTGRTASTAVSASKARRRGDVVRTAPAKLNLTLAVLRRLDTGYHALHSVMVPLGLADELAVSVARSQRRPGTEGVAPAADVLTVDGFDPGPAEENLVTRAFALTRASIADTWPGAPAVPPPLRAALVKRIPVAAGLAGGSSDGAAAIDAALRAWGAGIDARLAWEIASRLGSDVPFFLAGGAAVATGRGEHVQPVRGIVGTPPGVLLVTPRISLSTAAVFGVFDAGIRSPSPGAARLASEHLAAEMARGLTAGQLFDRAGVLASSNDLLQASIAIVPSLLGFRRALARLLGRPIGQSGSGPTAWILYPTLEAAEEAARVVTSAAMDGTLPAIGEGPPFVAATIIPPTSTASTTATASTAAAGATMSTTASRANDSNHQPGGE